MEQHYRRIVQDTDERVFYSLQHQETKEDSPYYGGFYDKDELVQAKYAIYRVASMIAAYCCSDSRFYHHQTVEKAVFLGLSYIRRVQHENGLFDYITCNFFSAPDTAFCIKKLIPVYEFLRGRKDKTQAEERIRVQLEEIIRKGAYGLLEGGFHTPNHRWAIASMLAKTGMLFQEQTLTQAAQAYLLEGIDCNEDGEFSEKSAGNYNRINNDAMITLAEALGEDSYEQYAIRNLKMMLTYLEPDGSIFTANSTRFDKDRLIFPKDYYMEYLRLGMKYRIPEFLDMCNAIFAVIQEKQITSPDFLIWFLMYPEYRKTEWSGVYRPADFCRFYEKSGILRARRGNFTYTVMKDKSDFLYLHNGTIKLMMKVAGSFCEHRAFKAESMEVSGVSGSLERAGLFRQAADAANADRSGSDASGQDCLGNAEGVVIHLHQTMRGWYYLPFSEKPDTSDWWQMDHAARPKKTGPDMEVDVYITELADGLRVRIKTSGVSGAPWRIEIAFAGIDGISTEHISLPVSGSEALVVRDETLQAYNRKDAIIMGPGFGAHRFTEGKEDSEAKTPGCATVYYTDYTEFDHTVTIRNSRDRNAVV